MAVHVGNGDGPATERRAALMEGDFVAAASSALSTLMEPQRFLFLLGGVLLGVIIGIIPGLGGLAATALLLPFTYTMDPYTALAFLLGLGAATATGDPIPAILFGVPGGAGSAATVLDGLPMAKRGEAGRALSAAYMSSLLGGLFGALLLGLAVPVLRPIMLHVGAPELLAISVFGLSMVAALSGAAPLRGLAVAGIGVMISMIGASPQTGTFRWTFGSLYLWDGLPLVPLTLGLFALPELCDLAVSRTSIAGDARRNVSSGLAAGARDVFRNAWLVLRCSWVGAAVGAIPGLGSAVVDWIAYGHALRSCRGARETFGTGDVRGVIAAESANNAKEGGALVPTIAFGVPGSASMAILLGAFLIHGVTPGPRMLTENLDLTYTMVWSVALANVFGAGLCYLFSAQFARIATLRYTLILPAVLVVMYVGAFESSRSWGDIYVLLLFGVVGWTMKQLSWPRAPLILGFVLGATIENNLFISIALHGADWIMRPAVLVLFALAGLTVLRPLVGEVRARRRSDGPAIHAGFRPNPAALFTLAIVAALAALLAEASTWPFAARVVPATVGLVAFACAAVSLVNQTFLGLGGGGGKAARMDLGGAAEELGVPTVLARAGGFLAWLLGFCVSVALFGMLVTIPFFVVAFMRFENREPWRLVAAQAVGVTAFVFLVFDQLLAIPWPRPAVDVVAMALAGLP